jgi:hypothetical protein
MIASPIQATRLACFHPNLIRLDVEQVQPGLFNQSLMDPLARLSSTIAPSSHGAFIQTVRLHNSLDGASKCQQRDDHHDQVLWPP